MVDVEPESGSTNIKTYQLHENHSAAKAELLAEIQREKKN
jgi:stress response protein SCP2